MVAYLGVGAIKSECMKLGCCLVFIAVAGFYPTSGNALGDAAQSTEAAGGSASDGASAELLDYTSKTHHELTELSTHWDELDSAQRRALLQEVKLRMARSKGAEGVLTIRSQRRYGRIVRKSDGRVLRIETQVVEVRPVKPQQAGAQPGFGVGFERRAESDEQPVKPRDIPVTGGAEELPPVVRVNDSSQ